MTVCALSADTFTENKNLEFSPRVHDFGTISETGGKVSHRFRVTNIGTKPQAILFARAGCTCISATTPSEPIKPGKSAYVTVTYDPDFRPGTFSKEIQVFSGDNHYNRIWVKGCVKPGNHPASLNHRYDFGHGLHLNYEVLNFATVAVGRSKTMKLGFASSAKETLRIDFRCPDRQVSLPAGYILRPGAEAIIPVTVIPAAAGETQTTLTPIVNGIALRPLKISFTTVP